MTDVALADEWITAKEVAAMTGMTVPAVRAWVHRGYGPPFYKFERSVRYKRSEVEAWVNAGRHETSPA